MATTNFWGSSENDSNFFFYYANHSHVEPNADVLIQPIAFEQREGVNKFYACPKYYPKSFEHEDGYKESESPCFNNLGFEEANKIVDYLMKEYEEQMENGIVADLTNFTFKVKQIDVEVLQQDSEGRLYLGIINNRALNK